MNETIIRLDLCGLLDEETFGRGYGEEVDFCLRATRVGLRHVVDDSTFVFHRGLGPLVWKRPGERIERVAFVARPIGMVTDGAERAARLPAVPVAGRAHAQASRARGSRALGTSRRAARVGARETAARTRRSARSRSSTPGTRRTC